MIGWLTAGFTRVYGFLGAVSMYRAIASALGILAVISLVLSFFGLVVPSPLELALTAVVLVVVGVAVDALAQRLLRLPHRLESSVITAGILLFVIRPAADAQGLVGVALCAAVAAASKYVLAWRGRHVFNPAAVGATVLTLTGLGTSAWWVGSPVLLVPVLILGLAVLWRTEKIRMATLFLVVAVAVGSARTLSQYQQAGLEVAPADVLWQILTASPFLFLGAFMLSEPLTLPPRRTQQLVVALVVGVLAGWPIDVGVITLGQERALLIGNLVAFAFALRTAVRLTLTQRTVGSGAVELTFRTARRLAFRAGQYLELQVPHRRPDARGTRREFSILSAPEELPVVRIAYRDAGGARESSFKRALADVQPGTALGVTGVWGDFLLPTDASRPLLLIAGGIGVTPFVSQLRHLRAIGQDRDIVLVYIVADGSQLAFRDDIAATGIPVVVFTRDDPGALPAGWRWAGRGARASARSLEHAVPDIAERHAYVSGPPGLISSLAPALERARSLTTDAFSGY